MIQRILKPVLLTLATTGLCAAQGQYGRGGGAAPASSLDMARLRTVSGSVSAVAIGYGMQYPSITIGNIQIKVAPIWYLQNNNFEIMAGDALSVQAAPSTSISDPALYAIEVTNMVTNQQLALRDNSGIPLWTGAQSATGAVGGGGCLAGADTAVVSGTIEQITGGVGTRMPTLALRLVEGSVVTLRIGPERVLLASGIQLKPGEPVKVKYATCIYTGAMVALTITGSAGKTVVLRDENGRVISR